MLPHEGLALAVLLRLGLINNNEYSRFRCN